MGSTLALSLMSAPVEGVDMSTSRSDLARDPIRGVV